MLLHALAKSPEIYKDLAFLKWQTSLVKFIKGQEKNFSFPYWVRNSKFNKTFPLPDDLDDTSFCISSLLSVAESIDERIFLKTINIESKTGGPYWTWYVPKDKKFKKWQDIDPAVNANFAYAASLYDLRLRSNENYLLRTLKSGKLLSKYYPNELITIFYLSRFYRQTKEQKFRDLILRRLKKYKYASLSKIEKVLFLLSNTNLGIKVPLSRINNLKVEPLPFCLGFSQGNGKKTFVGSKVITSALLLELIFMQEQIRNVNAKSSAETKKFPFIDSLEKTAKAFMKKRYLHHNVLSVPYFTALTLKKNLSKSEISIIKNLSLALFYSWRGYTMLDHVVDGQESLETHKNADILIKEAKNYFNKIKNSQFHKSLSKAFQVSDLSFIDESLKKKRNSYDYVEKRMAPFLISMKFLPEFLGLDSSKGESLYRIFRAQMIIDQLNDDAHDWKEDIDEGRNTFVTSRLFGINAKKRNSLFWNSLMPKVIKVCTKEYKTALKDIQKLKPLNNFFQSVIEKSYSPIKQAADAMKDVKRVIQSL